MITCSSSTALSLGAISSTLLSWSSRTAAMTSLDTPSAAAQRTESLCRRTPKRFVMVLEHIPPADRMHHEARLTGLPSRSKSRSENFLSWMNWM